MPEGTDNVTAKLVATAKRAAAALFPLIGDATSRDIDAAAVAAIRAGLADSGLALRVAVCEGIKDGAPRLAHGERVGRGAPDLDLAIDPVDGTRAVALGAPGAVVALAASRPGGFWPVGDLAYMEKLAVGPGGADIDLDAPIEENLDAVARALGKPPGALRVAILDRQRNRALAARVRDHGATVIPCAHADLAATVAVGIGAVDVAAGISGSPETVIAAAALACLGGEILARPWSVAGAPILRTADLAASPVSFAAAGVTDSLLLEGLTRGPGGLAVATLALESA